MGISTGATGRIARVLGRPSPDAGDLRRGAEILTDVGEEGGTVMRAKGATRGPMGTAPILKREQGYSDFADTLVAGGAIGFGALGIGSVAAALMSDRGGEVRKAAREGGERTHAALMAQLEKEAAAGGAWGDPTWPYRLRGILKRSGRDVEGLPISRNADADAARWRQNQAALRREWLRYYYGDAAAGTGKGQEGGGSIADERLRRILETP
jgi:hypothetical protein